MVNAMQRRGAAMAIPLGLPYTGPRGGRAGDAAQPMCNGPRAAVLGRAARAPIP